jgi:hypothetical protein
MMAKWQHIREAQGLRLNTVADLLMDDGKIVRATWKTVPGTLGNCSKKAEKIHCGLTAWWPDQPWRGQEKLGLYQPLSFRIVAEGAGTQRNGASYEADRSFLRENGLVPA